MKSSNLIHMMKRVLTIAIVLIMLPACSNVSRPAIDETTGVWKEEFNIADRKLTHTGQSKYFVLQPGFQIVLASQSVKLTITVLDEIKIVNGIQTRVIEEREEKNGELYEVSRNFFAIARTTGDVFYFGEDVDFYEKGNIVDHSGAWLAYVNGNQPGLIMPGNPEVGMKYYQELAPDISMDRAEVISISEICNLPTGKLENCLKTEETSKMKPTEKEYKVYAPDIGLVQEQSMTLMSYGYVNKVSSQK